MVVQRKLLASEVSTTLELEGCWCIVTDPASKMGKRCDGNILRQNVNKSLFITYETEDGWKFGDFAREEVRLYGRRDLTHRCVDYWLEQKWDFRVFLDVHPIIMDGAITNLWRHYREHDFEGLHLRWQGEIWKFKAEGTSRLRWVLTAMCSGYELPEDAKVLQ